MSDSGDCIIHNLVRKLESGAKDASVIKALLEANNVALTGLEKLRIRAVNLGKACSRWAEGECLCGYCLLMDAIYELDRWNDKL